MLSWLAPIVVFGVVIFVHELGHFIAAKLRGVYAPRFSVGFGPALFRKRWGETEYILAALPLGGYVRMASREDEAVAFLEGGGEHPPPETTGPGGTGKVWDDKSGARTRKRDWDPDAMVPFGPKPVPEHRWFESQPLWGRLFILIAGVTMNVVLALVASIGLVAYYGRPVVDTTVVGYVTEAEDVPSLRGLISPGDTIRAINGTPVSTWNEVQRELRRADGDTVVITTHRGDVDVPLPRGIAERTLLAVAALEPYIPPIIDSVVPEQPAARSGLQSGDSLVAVAGEPVRSWQDVSDLLASAAEGPVVIEFDRAGERRLVQILPESTQVRSRRTGALETRRMVGIAPREIARREHLGMGEAVVAGWVTTWDMGGLIIQVVKGLFTGGVSVQQLGGPIEITRASVQAAQQGVDQLLYWIAFISINIAILNLLPIPILDGGQIVLNVVETAKGSPFSTKTREYILRAGLFAILLLFIVVMWNDIMRWLGRL